MQLETQNLILRNHIDSDWEDMHEYASLPDFAQYDVWGPNTEEDTKNYIKMVKEEQIQNPRWKFNFSIVHKETGKIIGGIGIRRSSQKSLVADLGYAINPVFQNKGYSTEASKAIIDFGLNQLDLKVIYATCDVDNIASYKVMEKCGMKRVGELIKHREFKGRWHDSYRYEIWK